MGSDHAETVWKAMNHDRPAGRDSSLSRISPIVLVWIRNMQRAIKVTVDFTPINGVPAFRCPAVALPALGSDRATAQRYLKLMDWKILREEDQAPFCLVDAREIRPPGSVAVPSGPARSDWRHAGRELNVVSEFRHRQRISRRRIRGQSAARHADQARQTKRQPTEEVARSAGTSHRRLKLSRRKRGAAPISAWAQWIMQRL